MPAVALSTTTRTTLYRRLARGAVAASLGLTLGWPGSGHGETINVRTARLGDLLQVPVFSAPATVVARNAPGLAAEISARIEEITVEVGDAIAADDLLLRLDCRRYEALLAMRRAAESRAQAQHRFAGQQLERARNLQRKKSISEELLDQRRTDLVTAEADLRAREQEVRQAALDVAHCELRAPFDAVVTDRLVSIGGYATAGSVLLHLLEAGGQEVSVALRHDQASGLQAAAGTTFVGDAGEYPIRLRALLPLIDPTTRTREARLTFGDRAAVVGTPGRVVWRGPRSLLPSDYLVRRGTELGVFVLAGEKARFVAVPGAEDGRPARVDLAPDTRLVTDGRQRLVDGSPVRPVPAGGPN